MEGFKIIDQKFKDIQSATNYIRDSYKKGEFFLCVSEGVLASYEKVLKEHNLHTNVIFNIKNAKPNVVNICNFFAKSSFFVNGKTFLTEQAVFGRVVSQAKTRREVSQKKQLLLANSFEIGDLVVHKKHGVAVFEGLFMVKTQGREYDTAKLVYQGGDALYVPVTNIDFITKYGSVPEGISKENLLDKLHTGGFEKKREKVKKNLLEIAEKLVLESAKRKQMEASCFFENENTQRFDEKFLFALTEDQSLAIEDCVEDLSSGRPMERLICGDVGFGKTEVAMRCCALITLGKELGGAFGQVCVICPTTLLVQQHFKTFTQRFFGFNVKIAKITRTTSAKERKEIIVKIQNGEVDILIATHAGFSEEIKFQNLELLIIDEEQHFGVQQKEKIKSRFPCHVLLLSATPIPRTLQMGLSGLKEISIIATPPFDRLLPKTQVMTFDPIVISNAIIREKKRNGRTFFVCPRVADLEEQKVRILAITGGEVSVGIAHGGMPPAELEVVMEKFYTGVFDVLVTTSIVESGIDISFANTMILYRAEMFGLSALYQLRGRVGRGKVQSYVYFVAKDVNRMTENAKQRLKAISSINSLGEGMKIAVSDLDIRGAGNIVGREQSGKMNDVGVELYEAMLKEAVVKVKNININIDEEFEPEIKISIPFFIPEEYIPDFNIRMQVYREISNVSSTESVEILMADIIDRFGRIPQPVLNLMEIVKVKILAKTLKIHKLEAGIKGVVLTFSPQFEKSEAMLEEIANKPKSLQIKSSNSVFWLKDGEDLLTKTYNSLKWVQKL